ncbi:hypothetical protein G7Y89_g1123 [Cudoniella acicularis]|uniref:Uncharacterized protein n=1 Tax=Cudoniella acicularis TaxID=354080 RepID=A0A8H4W9T5_9HELO|nr:hypothetical protein G7Y89_g1123 [Cudoniella acicularis]
MLPGGVCAVLDYEVSQMTDYVAEMAQRLCIPGSSVSPAFRKFVSGLLSSTRLPSTTILLGMNYLARRVNMLSSGPRDFKISDGQVWRMLTIGLLLGSKFLDDNTFQNRSWSEVSGISVAELNKLEHEWLEGIAWNLYVNLDESKDFKAWLQSWNEWRETKNLQRTATLDRLAPLAPIDTNVQRARPYSNTYSAYTKSASREHPQSGFQHSGYETSSWMNSYPTPHLTPPSAPDSGVNTPDYLSATGGGPRYNDWALFNQYSRGYQPQAHSSYAPTRVAAYHTPFTPHYGNHYGSNIWENVPECGCGNCNPHTKQPYFMSHGYGGQQIVAG